MPTNPLPRRHTVRQVVASAAILLAVAGCTTDDGAFGVESIAAEQVADFADFSFLIPAGTGLDLDAGEPVDILPADLDARVGQTIKIVNEDDRGHTVGPWFVAAGQTVTQRFASPGELVGNCTVHPSGLISITISA